MSDKNNLNRRTFLLTTFFTSAQLLLFGRLYYLQMVQGNKYKIMSDKNRTRMSILYPLRGHILDRNKLILSVNKLSYNVVYDPKIVDNKNKLLNNLFSILNLDDDSKYNIEKNIYHSKNIVSLINDIDWEDIVKIEINQSILKGIYIESYYKRFYPYAEIIAHLLGYVRTVYGGSRLFYDLYVKELIGYSGAEFVYNDFLKGKQGFVHHEVNSHNIIVKELSRVQSTAGNDIQMTIDINLQKYIYNLLRDLVISKGASVSVMNVNTGEVLALVNYPSYDNNIFTDKLSEKEWNKYISNRNNPMMNRCISSRISPGSIFKILIALVLLEENLIALNETVECSGKIRVGDRDYHCWKKSGHGKLNLHNAIVNSCNIYIYQMVKRIQNIDLIFDMANELGLGSTSKHTKFKEELSGLIPNKDWLKHNNIPWYLGDKINLSIGQGYVTATPMQIMVMTARIASKKKVNPIFTLYNSDSDKFSSLSISDKSLDIVRKAMHGVVKEPKGTAHYSMYNTNFSFAGKTGTVENTNKDNHSVFTGFMNYEKPEYAITVILENNDSKKSVRATNIARYISKYIYDEL